jgi:DNA-binding LacI/PurR family transcriptional regulator
MTVTGRVQSRSTLAVVAREAGVSVPTVSKVLRARADVAPATRERVRGVLDRFGYPPDLTGVSAAKLNSVLVDVLVHELDTAWAGRLLTCLEREARARNLGIVLHAGTSGGTRPVPHRQWLDQIAARGTRGALGVLVDFSASQLDYLVVHGIPCVVIDPPGPAPSHVVTIHTTNRDAQRRATEHLIELGHRRIAVVAGNLGVLPARERLAGFHDAIAAAGLVLPEAYLRTGGFSLPESTRAMRELLALARPPTAVVFASDKGALGGYAAAAAAGLRIPADISVVGFDDTAPAASAIPALTTVRQPIEQMVRLAVAAVVGDPVAPAAAGGRLEFPAELIVRASTAPPGPAG